MRRLCLRAIVVPILAGCALSSAAQRIGVKIDPERDFRALQSPVKNQRDRGTCTAFAITAALETFPGVPHDLSEQSIHGLAKFEQVQNSRIAYLLSRGDEVLKKIDTDGLPSFRPYERVLREFGVTRESVLPYNPNGVVVSQALRRSVPSGAANALAQVIYRRAQLTPDQRDRLIALARYKVVDLELVEFAKHREETIPLERLRALDAATKRLAGWLRTSACGHQAIPICYLIHKQLWGRYAFADETPVLTLAPMLRKAAEEKARRAKETDPKKKEKTLFGGHAVTIVGYTENIRQYVPSITGADAKKAYWIIKNSWGPHWGNAGGYGFVSLDYHRACASQAMLIRRVEIDFRKIAVDISDLLLKTGPKTRTPERIEYTFTNADLHLKIQPSAFWKSVASKGLLIATRKSVTLSTAVYEAVEPDIRAVRYRIEYREGEVATNGDITWAARRAIYSPLLRGGVGSNWRNPANARSHAFTWTVLDAGLSDAAKRFATRRHKGHLEIRVCAAYDGPKPGGGIQLNTGRFFETRYAGGSIDSRDLGGDAAGHLPKELAARVFPELR